MTQFVRAEVTKSVNSFEFHVCSMLSDVIWVLKTRGLEDQNISSAAS
jgi:hypothetical protein